MFCLLNLESLHSAQMNPDCDLMNKIDGIRHYQIPTDAQTAEPCSLPNYMGRTNPIFGMSHVSFLNNNNARPVKEQESLLFASNDNPFMGSEGKEASPSMRFGEEKLNSSNNQASGNVNINNGSTCNGYMICSNPLVEKKKPKPISIFSSCRDDVSTSIILRPSTFGEAVSQRKDDCSFFSNSGNVTDTSYDPFSSCVNPRTNDLSKFCIVPPTTQMTSSGSNFNGLRSNSTSSSSGVSLCLSSSSAVTSNTNSPDFMANMNENENILEYPPFQLGMLPYGSSDLLNPLNSASSVHSLNTTHMNTDNLVSYSGNNNLKYLAHELPSLPPLPSLDQSSQPIRLGGTSFNNSQLFSSLCSVKPVTQVSTERDLMTNRDLHSNGILMNSGPQQILQDSLNNNTVFVDKKSEPASNSSPLDKSSLISITSASTFSLGASTDLSSNWEQDRRFNGSQKAGSASTAASMPLEYGQLPMNDTYYRALSTVGDYPSQMKRHLSESQLMEPVANAPLFDDSIDRNSSSSMTRNHFVSMRPEPMSFPCVSTSPHNPNSIPIQLHQQCQQHQQYQQHQQLQQQSTPVPSSYPSKYGFSIVENGYAAGNKSLFHASSLGSSIQNDLLHPTQTGSMYQRTASLLSSDGGFVPGNSNCNNTNKQIVKANLLNSSHAANIPSTTMSDTMLRAPEYVPMCYAPNCDFGDTSTTMSVENGQGAEVPPSDVFEEPIPDEHFSSYMYPCEMWVEEHPSRPFRMPYLICDTPAKPRSVGMVPPDVMNAPIMRVNNLPPLPKPSVISPKKAVFSASDDGDESQDKLDPMVNPRVFSGKKARKNVDYSKHLIDLDRLRSGEETRLTVMLKNIPNGFTQEYMLRILDNYVENEYDFFYMPVDFKTNCNLGFGYISLTTSESVIALYNNLNGKRWPNTPSTKICEIAFARMQGRNDMQRLCKDWAIMQLPEKYRPAFFESSVQRVKGKDKVVMRRVKSIF